MPIIWGIVALGSMIVAAVGCSSDNGTNGTGSPEIDGGNDTDSDTGTGVDTDTDTESDTDVDAGVDPWIREGFNGKFYDCSYGAPCSIVDMDMDREEDPDTVFLMTGYSTNRKGTLALDTSDPMSAPTSAFSTGAFDSLGAQIDGVGLIKPVQIVKFSNGRYFVPSAIESDDANKKSLVSIMDPEISDYSSSNVQSGVVDSFCETDGGAYDNACADVDTDPVTGTAYHPVGISSGVFVGDVVYMTAQDESDAAGAVLGFGLTPDGFVDNNNLQMVIPTSGNEASAIEYLGGNEVVVLNNSGVGGASADIVDLEDASIVATIPLGLENAGNLSEVPVIEGGLFAATAGQDSSGQAVFKVVDLSDDMVAGSALLAQDAEVRAIDILGSNAYISLEAIEHSKSSGQVAIVDFSTPTAPVLTALVQVGFDCGTIAAYGAGFVYVVVTDRWWEEPGTSESRWSHVVAFNPDLMDPDELGI